MVCGVAVAWGYFFHYTTTDRAALYETVAAELGLMLDEAKLQAMKEKNAAELEGLDEKYVQRYQPIPAQLILYLRV